MYRSLRVMAVVGTIALLSPARDGSIGPDNGSEAALAVLRTLDAATATADRDWTIRLWTRLPDSIRAVLAAALLRLGAPPGSATPAPSGPRSAGPTPKSAS